MRKIHITKTAIGVLIIFIASIYVDAQEAFRTEIFRDEIKSLEIKVEDELISTPYIELNGEKKIEIIFDALHHTGRRFAYSVIHCNADWTQSNLLPIEYMRGFRNITIEDFANSINTTIHYTNHNILLPNEEIQFRVSGNYAVQVYEEDNPDNIVFTACFSIVEPLVEIEASVSGNTDIDFNKKHQQIDFNINQRNINIAYPQNDLKILVFQNNNRSDIRTALQPMIISNNQLQYKHNRNLIFEAGNEYRRIEFLTHRYNGMGVESTDYYNPYYHLTLFQDKRRDRKSYLYDQDQNGRFFIRCSGCEDPDTEADYFVVHFSLESEFIEGGNIHIYGGLFNNITNDKSRMEYNTESGAYEKALVLKSGVYNYQYAFVENEGTRAMLSKTEGSFSETENEYTIEVYYRPAGERYDRLIGVKSLRSKHGLLRTR